MARRSLLRLPLARQRAGSRPLLRRRHHRAGDGGFRRQGDQLVCSGRAPFAEALVRHYFKPIQYGCGVRYGPQTDIVRRMKMSQSTESNNKALVLEAPIPRPSDGQVLIRTLWLSVDPAQRIWMARDSYKPAVPLGDVM